MIVEVISKVLVCHTLKARCAYVLFFFDAAELVRTRSLVLLLFVVKHCEYNINIIRIEMRSIK